MESGGKARLEGRGGRPALVWIGLPWGVGVVG